MNGQNVQVITGIEVRDGKTAIHVMPFLVLNDGLDLRAAVRDACRDHVTSSPGAWADWNAAGRRLDWLGFFDSVPNSTCIAHGFMKLAEKAWTGHVSVDEDLLAGWEPAAGPDVRDAVVDYLMAGGMDGAERFMLGIGKPFTAELHSPGEAREIIARAVSGMDAGQLMDYYMENVKPVT